LLALGVGACFDKFYQNQSQSISSGGSNPLGPDPVVACTVARIRVGLFGNCGAPSGVVPIGCEADGTATPLLANGEKAPSEIHGNNVRLEVTQGGDKIDFALANDNAFNFTALGKATGPFTVKATLVVNGCPAPIVGESSGLRVQ
jgi:hypothetical protein